MLGSTQHNRPHVPCKKCPPHGCCFSSLSSPLPLPCVHSPLPNSPTPYPPGLFYGLTRYTELSENAEEEVERYYKYFVDVQVGVRVY